MNEEEKKDTYTGETNEAGTAGSGTDGADDSLKSRWAAFGKGMGRSMAGLGKTIIKSAKAGVERIDDDGEAPKISPTELKSSWKAVGKSFGMTASNFGRAVEETLDRCDIPDKESKEAKETKETKK